MQRKKKTIKGILRGLNITKMSQGSLVGYLCRVRATACLPVIEQAPPAVSPSTPAFAGDVAAYITANPKSEPFLMNKVKKCTHCGKPNGFTLKLCNQCGTSIAETPNSFTPNVFMAFVFGIAKASFPLTISVRYQDNDFLVMDDLLALSPLHFNIIPTSRFIPDWRFLLRRPKEGLDLIESMLGRCNTVAREQFLSNKEWSSALLKHSEEFSPEKDMCCGFNYPPSQNQLHIQYICPNVMPFQHAQYLKGIHFTFGRFFPFRFVAKALEVLASSSSTVPEALLQEDTPVEAIIEYLQQTWGISYQSEHALFYLQFAELSAKYSNWSTDLFDGYAVPSVTTPALDNFIPFVNNGIANLTIKCKELVAEDKLALQNYGRPYDAAGRPTGSFYAFPKVYLEIESW